MELYLKVRLAIREGMSAREAARHFGLSRESVKKMLSFSVPPGYRRTAPIKRPKLDGFTEIIEPWLHDDVGQHGKQPSKNNLNTSCGGRSLAWPQSVVPLAVKLVAFDGQFGEFLV